MIKLNGVELTFKVFPNGETLVDGDQINELIGIDCKFEHIHFKYENDSDLIKLMLVKNHIDESFETTVDLTISYMMYSRMDRVEGNSVFTLKYVSNFVNALNFSSIEVIEPHSDVTMALLNKSFATYPSINLLPKVIDEVGFDINKDYLFFPDFGAQKRYSKVKGYKQLVGNKKRDFNTGKINSLEVVGNVELTGLKVIIVDDLSSYGGTFVMSGRALHSLGASEIYLLITHAEQSIYDGEIFKAKEGNEDSHINKVFTTDSILNKEENSNIKIYPLEERFNL